MAKVNTTELAQETGLPTEDVKKVVEQIIINKNNHRREPKPQPPEGGISLRATARKYRINHRTLSRWVRMEYIPVLLRTKNEVYIDENKAAEVIKLYKTSPGQGKKTIAQMMSNET